MKVTAVPPEGVPIVWPDVVEYFRPAVDMTKGRYELEDVLDLVARLGYILWVAYDGEFHIKGAVITGEVVYPKAKYLNMVFCGGEEGLEWKDPMLDVLRSWAKCTGCKGLEGNGRAGWAKIFAGDGHRTIYHTFEIPLGNTHG